MSTFADVLTAQLRHDPGRPFVTFYDHATSERTELSLTTYANWVAKAAGLLQEEGDVERGTRVRIDLPAHWLAPVFLGAVWSLGATAAFEGAGDAVVCGPERLAEWAGSGAEVFACSLAPLGARFADPVPAGVHDVGVEIWSQPDAFAPWDPPTGDDAALADPATSQADLMRAATVGTLLTDGGRLLSVTAPASPPGVATLTEPLARSGSLVLVRHPDPALLDRLVEAERITDRA